MLRDGEGDLCLGIHPLDIALHRDRIECAADALVCVRKDLPHSEVDRAPLIGALSAEDGRCWIVLRKQIARSKDVCALGVRAFLSIGSKLHEKVVVIIAPLRTSEQVLKKRIGALVVAPEYRAIVLHFSLTSPVNQARSASSNTRKKPLISASSIAPSAQRRNVDDVCILPG